jgi:hypothetical protein
MSNVTNPLTIAPGQRPGRLAASLLLAVGLAAGALTAFAASPASAASAVRTASAVSACDPGADFCVVPQTAQTPLGAVSVAVSAGNVVTVQLTPIAAGTLMLGIPFAIPPGPPGLAGYARTSITTSCGLVNIDTFQSAQGLSGRFVLPNLVIVSIHPPNPCRVRTSGTTVVFTPVVPPGPPC